MFVISLINLLQGLLPVERFLRLLKRGLKTSNCEEVFAISRGVSRHSYLLSGLISGEVFAIS